MLPITIHQYNNVLLRSNKYNTYKKKKTLIIPTLCKIRYIVRLYYSEGRNDRVERKDCYYANR